MKIYSRALILSMNKSLAEQAPFLLHQAVLSLINKSLRKDLTFRSDLPKSSANTLIVYPSKLLQSRKNTRVYDMAAA